MKEKKDDRVRISMVLDREIYDRLKAYAEDQHQSMTGVVTRWIMDAPVINKIDYRTVNNDSFQEK